jgi:hypothetical protein
VNLLAGVGRAAKEAAQQAAGDIERVGQGAAGRAVKGALITAAAAITEELKLKTAIGAEVVMIASEFDKRHLEASVRLKMTGEVAGL